MTKLILASASPRRREMLQMLDVPFRVLVSEADESCSETDPEAFALAVSKKKAEAVLALSEEDEIVIACDTVVALGDQILGKPKDRADAKRMLCALSGKSHRVVSALCVANKEKVVSLAVVTKVHFRTIKESELQAYLMSGECDDKAGAYGIQGLGGLFVSGIEGDWYTVVGMPLSALNEILKTEFQTDFFSLRRGKEGCQ